MPGRIDALARRVESDPEFLASALADYARSEGLDDEGLAAVLGCSVTVLGPLRLCLRPRPQAGQFRTDVDEIATRFGVRRDALVEVVRRADALAALRRPPSSQEHGLLMAARDRAQDDSEVDRTEGTLP